MLTYSKYFVIVTIGIIVLYISTSSALPVQDSTLNPIQDIKPKIGRQLDADFGSYLLVSPVSPFDYSNLNPIRQMGEKFDEVERIDDDVIVTKPLTERGELMHTAENLVFRPLFSYRKLQEKRRRLHGNSHKNQASSNSPNALRRSSYVYPATNYPNPTYQYSGYPYNGYYYNNGQYYYPH